MFVRHPASGSWPTLWSALLIFQPRTNSCLVIFVRHEQPDAASTRPRRWSGMSAYAEFRSPPIAHHNIHFGDEWSSAFDALLDRGQLMPDPSRLVTIPSLDDPTMAPTGCSTLYVLEPVPNLNGKINWSTEAEPLRERLHAFLAQQGYPSEVITEELVTPLDWQAQGMAAGTPFALGPHVWPDRTVPSVECRTSAARDVLRRLRNGPGSRRAYGAHLRQAGGQPSSGIPSGARLVSDWNSYEAQLAEGYRRCAKLTWRYGTTYFWGAALLPKPQRKHVHAIYALCRLADDIVDLPDGDHPRRPEPGNLRTEPVEGPESGASTSSTHNTDVPEEPEPTLPDPDPLGPDLAEGLGSEIPSQAQLTASPSAPASRPLRKNSEAAWPPVAVQIL